MITLFGLDRKTDLEDVQGAVAAQPRRFRALLINSSWPYDIQTWFIPKGPIPHGVAMLYHEPPGSAVILAQVLGVQQFARLEKAEGRVEIPIVEQHSTRWQWLSLADVEGEWVFIPTTHVHGLLEADKETDGAGGNGKKKPDTIAAFIQTVTQGDFNWDLPHISPYEFGSDLQLVEYKRQTRKARLRELAKSLQTTAWILAGGLAVAVFLMFIVALDNKG